ncbi:MAG: hypothetical protein AAF413_01020 [Patescibacteria group bacterium]
MAKQTYALNDTIHEMLSSFASKPQGSLLIIGKEGSGLSTSLRYIIHSIYGEKPRVGELFLFNDYTIDGVRTLIRELGQKRSNPKKPRMIVIDDFEKLQHEAQNALLKSIEEPPEGTHFVLTTSNEDKVLGTIASRCQVVKMKRPAKEELRKIFTSSSDAEFERAYLIADGWPGLLRQILEGGESEFLSGIEQAKQYLSGSISDRLIWAIKNKQPEDFDSLTDSLARITQSTIRSLSLKNKNADAREWLDRAIVLQDVRSQREQGVSPKLLALYLGINV